MSTSGTDGKPTFNLNSTKRRNAASIWTTAKSLEHWGGCDDLAPQDESLFHCAHRALDHGEHNNQGLKELCSSATFPSANQSDSFSLLRSARMAKFLSLIPCSVKSNALNEFSPD